jgi:hypothetical protein
LAKRETVGVQLIAIFMTEETNEEGERVGYVDLFDPAQHTTVAAQDFDDNEFMSETDARRLAQERGWRFRLG